MPTILKFRRGTTTQNNAYTGAAGELSIDTSLNQIRVHDGSTAGGTTVGAGGEVVDDTTPQLGGNLDLNSNDITGTGNIDNVGTITTDGLTVAGNVSVDGGTIKLDGNYPTGTDNLALGDTALDAGSLSGGGNTAIGSKSLSANTTGENNTALGESSLFLNTTGVNNVAIGKGALQNNTYRRNTAVGYSAGSSVTSGENLTLLGHNAEPSSATATNEITLGDANVTSLRIPGLSSAATTGDVLTFDGTSLALSAPAAGGTSWQAVKTSAFTAVAGEGYFIDTTSAAITMTLPTSPSQGDEVSFIDYAGTADTNAITIARNGSNIAGSATDLTVSVERAANSLVYVDSTQGWLLTSK